MKKIIVSCLVLAAVITTGITGYAASSRDCQFTRPCASWCQDAVKKGVAASVSDAAGFANKRVLTYKKAGVLDKKAVIADAAEKNDTAAKTDTTSKADTAAKTDTASAQAAAAPAQTAPASAQAAAVPAQTAAVYTDTTAVVNQVYCSHGYCVGQCPYSDCPHGGYCADNNGYQYQDNWNDASYANGGGDTYVYDDYYHGAQAQDYSCYQGYDQSYGCQGGYGQGYGSGHHGEGHGHH